MLICAQDIILQSSGNYYQPTGLSVVSEAVLTFTEVVSLELWIGLLTVCSSRFSPIITLAYLHVSVWHLQCFCEVWWMLLQWMLLADKCSTSAQWPLLHVSGWKIMTARCHHLGDLLPWRNQPDLKCSCGRQISRVVKCNYTVQSLGELSGWTLAQLFEESMTQSTKKVCGT